MADEIDLANTLIDNELRFALEKIRQNSAQNVMGTKFCVECDDEMPDARQKLGFKYCVACAGERERRKSLFAEE